MQEGSPSAQRGCSHAGLAGFSAHTFGETPLGARAVGLEAEQGEGEGRELHGMCRGGPCYAAAPSQLVLLLHNPVSVLAALLRHVLDWTRWAALPWRWSSSSTPMANGIWDSMLLDALSQGAVAGSGSHPPRKINIANCMLWLKPSLLGARACCCSQAFNQTVEGHA